MRLLSPCKIINFNASFAFLRRWKCGSKLIPPSVPWCLFSRPQVWKIQCLQFSLLPKSWGWERIFFSFLLIPKSARDETAICWNLKRGGREISKVLECNLFTVLPRASLRKHFSRRCQNMDSSRNHECIWCLTRIYLLASTFFFFFVPLEARGGQRRRQQRLVLPVPHVSFQVEKSKIEDNISHSLEAVLFFLCMHLEIFIPTGWLYEEKLYI